MASITTHLVEKHLVPYGEGGIPGHFFTEFTLSSGNQDDTVELAELIKGVRCIDAVVSVSGTLGTSVTLKLVQGDEDVTGATTADQASTVTRTAFPPAASEDGDYLRLVIGGGNVGTAATVKVYAALLRE